MIRKIYYTIIISLVFGFGLFTCIGGLFEDMCGNKIISEIPSPDLKLKAVIFTRNCGATTGFSTQVSLIPITENLSNTGGNILTTSSNGKAPIWKHGGIPVEVNWESKERLKISYHRGAETFTKEVNFQGITIIYETNNGTQPTTPPSHQAAE